MKMEIERIFLPYTEWEEVNSNMWGVVSNRKYYLDKAVKFTGDHGLYGSFMFTVLFKWPKSCEHNLTNLAQNRRAWIGHAACAIAIDCPEDIVREAWSYITDEQRMRANSVADSAIKYWEQNIYKENTCRK